MTAQKESRSATLTSLKTQNTKVSESLCSPFAVMIFESVQHGQVNCRPNCSADQIRLAWLSYSERLDDADEKLIREFTFCVCGGWYCYMRLGMSYILWVMMGWSEWVRQPLCARWITVLPVHLQAYTFTLSQYPPWHYLTSVIKAALALQILRGSSQSKGCPGWKELVKTVELSSNVLWIHLLPLDTSFHLPHRPDSTCSPTRQALMLLKDMGLSVFSN